MASDEKGDDVTKADADANLLSCGAGGSVVEGYHSLRNLAISSPAGGSWTLECLT